MIGVMNNTRWNELRLAMYTLGDLSPRWRTKDRVTGHISAWDGEWFYHFRNGGYDTIEWVEIATTTAAQHDAVRTALRSIHVPGEEMPTGFRVLGWVAAGAEVKYI